MINGTKNYKVFTLIGYNYLYLRIKSLDELSSITKIDRGSLSRYLNQERRPSIDPICASLEITSDDLLIVLGARDRNTSS